jgi:hypothetical protein
VSKGALGDQAASSKHTPLSFMHLSGVLATDATNEGATTANESQSLFSFDTSGSKAGSNLPSGAHGDVQFSIGQAIVWQIKFIINCYLTKKSIAQASAEL